MYIENLNTGAEPVVAAEPQQTQTQEPVQTQEPTTPVQTGEPVAAAEPEKVEKAFAARLAAEKSKIETQYKPYLSFLEKTAQSFGFNSPEEYLKAVEEAEQQQALQQQAEQFNVNPDFMKKFQELESKVMTYEQKEQLQKQQEFETKVLSDAEKVIQAAAKDGVNLTVDQLLEAAEKEGIVDMNKVYKLCFKPEVDVEALKQKAIAEHIEALRAGRVPVEGGGAAPVVVNEGPKTFEDARKGALEYLRAARNK